MRTVIYAHMVSADGFIEADPGQTNGENWAVADEGLQQHFIELEKRVDAHLYGRAVYQQLAASWPAFAEDATLPDSMREYARMWVAKPKYVFSSTLEQAGPNTTVVRDDAARLIAELKSLPGNDLTLYGGRLAASLIGHGLIDEYRLYVNPVVLGRGTPMFPGLASMLRLRLLATESFQCGVVLLRYAAG